MFESSKTQMQNLVDTLETAQVSHEKKTPRESFAVPSSKPLLARTHCKESTELFDLQAHRQ